MSKKIYELLYSLGKIGAEVYVEEDSIKVKVGEVKLSSDLVYAIKDNREELIQFLKDQKNKSEVPSQNSILNKQFFSKISKAPSALSYVLSSSQYRLWILSQFTEASIAYHISGGHNFKGDFDRNFFVRSFQDLIERHEILRTVFKIDNEGVIRQFILSPLLPQFKICYQDMRLLNMSDEIFKSYINQEAQKPFNLETGPLLRATLYQLSDSHWFFTYTIHHIISDAWSMQILFAELLKIYGEYKLDKKPSLAPLEIQYKDYAFWQQAQLKENSFQHHKDYWLRQFSGDLPRLELLTDRPRPTIKSYKGSQCYGSIKSANTARLRKIIAEQDATMFMGLLAIVKVLLYRYSGQEDIIIGTPISGREHPDLHNQIGFYVNTLAIRTRLDKADSFNNVLDAVKAVTIEAYDHQIYPFDQLIEELGLLRDTSRNALFDIMVTYSNSEKVYTSNNSSNILLEESTDVEIDNKNSKFDLTFNFTEDKEHLFYCIEYNIDLWNESTIARLEGHFNQLVDSIIGKPDKKICELEYLLQKERQDLLHSFNSSKSDFLEHRTIIVLFEEQVNNKPDAIALIFEDSIMTYKMLNEESNRFAYYLKGRYDINQNDLVAVKLQRSEWMIVAILAILKLKAAYVPIDNEHPKDRVDYILRDCNCRMLINDKELMAYKSHRLDYPSGNQMSYAAPEDPMYVIYTSGSTGNIKGVLIKHSGFVNMILCQINEFGIKSRDVVCQFSSLSFDSSVSEIFMALLSGAALVVTSKERISYSIDFIRYIKDKGVTVLFLPPSYLTVLNWDELRFLRVLITAGESAKVSDALYCSRFLEYYNAYGPTEFSVCATIYKVSALDELHNIIPIGKPIANTKIYLLDANQQLVPIGIAGEIYLEGIGQFSGYVNNDALTNEKLIISPFDSKRKLYKTGDIGRWKADGNVEFLGRADDQVKIRGYRIELGEIESVLERHSDIDSAVVLVHTDHLGDKQLVAYIISGNHSFSLSECKRHAGQFLPLYMIPSRFVLIDSIPLTTNGKIDRKKLISLEITDEISDLDYVSPSNELEEKIIKIWLELLDLKTRIGVNDNFFERGGHSLKATQLLSFFYKEFGAKVSFTELFTNPTVKGQAILIKEKDKVSFDKIQALEKQDSYVLSSSQRRLWILSQFPEASIAYHISGIHIFKAGFDRDCFSSAFNSLIQRHEILRTVFRNDENGEVRQVILDHRSANFRMDFKDLRGQYKKEDELKKLISFDLNKPFDLSSGPLMRSMLYLLDDDYWFFSYSMHHIISDGWSMRILLEELLSIYEAYKNGEEITLPELSIQYKDYAYWQQQQLKGQSLEKHKLYWLAQFDGELPVLSLLTDKPRSSVKTYKGSNIYGSFDDIEIQFLKQTSINQGGTLFMSLLAIVNILLYKYTRQKDIILGTTIAGREHADLERQIGFYVNTLALRFKFSEEDSFSDLFDKVKKVTLGAYEHQMYPFDDLIDELNLERDMSRNALFDVMVTMHKTEWKSDADSRKISALNIENFTDEESVISKFDLTFSFTEEKEMLLYNIEYNTDLYNRATIERMSFHLMEIVREASKSTSPSIKRMEYLPKSERQELLHVFNPEPSEFPLDKTIIELFEEQVSANGEKEAIIFNNSILTYHELNNKSNQLSRFLRHKFFIGYNDRVAVKTGRSEWTIIAILSVLKAGAVYVPIDYEIPEDRTNYILSDCGCKLLIDEELLLSFLQVEKEYDKGNLYLPLEVNSPFAIIYTSGSTGMPKGVKLSQLNVLNRLYWMWSQYPFDMDEVNSIKTSISFVDHIWELFGPLLKGVKGVIFDKFELVDIPVFIEKLSLNHISRIVLVPSLLSEILTYKIECKEKLQDLKYWFCSGENLPMSLVHLFYHVFPSYRLYNIYGSTEVTADSTLFDTSCFFNVNNSKEANGVATDRNMQIENLPSDFRRVPIGKPIGNTSAYILDSDYNLCGIGIAGEIYIGGKGLADGYLNDEKLNNQKFVPNPFINNDRLFRTGDIGRWLADGNIEYLGRRDHQIKIRGMRVDLREIEFTLQKHPSIETAIVVAPALETGRIELVAYVFGSKVFRVRELKDFMAKSLPLYMIPNHYVQLDKLPLNYNGKVDIRKLPYPDDLQESTGIEYISAANETEKKLTSIWSEVLIIPEEKISVVAGFFEMGGNSLKLIKVSHKIKVVFDIDLPASSLFQLLTIRQIADVLFDKLSGREFMGEPDDYINRIIYDTCVVFNAGSSKKMFCFAPGLGLGIAYKSLATYFTDYEIHCFNYLSGHDNIGSNADYISKHCSNNEAVLLGYSSGGVIAYEVLKKLEFSGFKVGKLILLDTLIYRSATTIDQIEEAWKVIPPYIQRFNIEKEEAKLKLRFLEYAKFCSSLITEGLIDADIHFINAKDGEQIESRNKKLMTYSEIEKCKPWSQLTKGNYIFHEGFGDHTDMLSESFIQDNIAIIRNVLNDIYL